MTLGCQHTIHARNHHIGWNRTNKPAMHILPGETVELDVVDTGGGQITPQTTISDLDSLRYGGFAPLTGPIFIDGAKPGDALKITFLSFDTSGWGWSMITPRYGILTDDFQTPFLKIWHYDPSCRNPAMHADVARIPLKPFPGIIGVAPAVSGTHASLQPRNVGGNMDMRDLSIGSVLYLPVEVTGGLLSVGDTHAAQGNGELAGTALESPMRVALKVDLEKNIGIPGPWIQTSGPVARHLDAKGYHITCGVHEDLVEAARLATRHMIDLLGKVHGLLPIDAYLLCSVCGDLAISEMVNKPVSVVSLYFPRVVLE